MLSLKQIKRQEKRDKKSKYWEKNLEYQQKQRAHYERFAPHSDFFKDKLNKHIKKYGTPVKV